MYRRFLDTNPIGNHRSLAENQLAVVERCGSGGLLVESPKPQSDATSVPDPDTKMITFAAPPDIPADRAEALRKAFDATMKDAEFLADAKKLNIEIAPVSADRLDGLVKKLYQTPKPIIEEARKAIQ